MDVRTHSRSLVPIVGGMSAMVTTVGAVAVVTHSPVPVTVGTVGAPGSVTAPTGALESCEAYFGFGKEEAALNLVELDVLDQNGDDGVDHAVPDDTHVAFVLHFDNGPDVECAPYEVTAQMWADEFDPDWPLPFPGPGHYVYPSIVINDGDGQDEPAIHNLTGVGFRVLDHPAGEHSLVSPTGERALPDLQFWHSTSIFDMQIDPLLNAFLLQGVGQTAVDIWADGAEACAGGYEGFEDAGLTTDEDMLEALNFLAEFLDDELAAYTEADCANVGFTNAYTSQVLRMLSASTHVQGIVLALPEQEPPTTPSTDPLPPTVDADTLPVTK